MKSSRCCRVSADGIELRKPSSPREIDARPNPDDSESSIKACASASALQSTLRAVDNGKPGFFARWEAASLQNMRNERMLVSHGWSPGTWAQLPWAGLKTFLFVVVPTGAAAAVIAVSNGSPAGDWQVRGVAIQPQVWLSVLATVMDSLIIYALFHRTAVTFWKISMYGTQLRNLYDYFESTGVVGAFNGILQGRLNTIAVACILAALSALRGPLLQRATPIDDHAQLEKNGTMELRMAQFLPPGYLWDQDMCSLAVLPSCTRNTMRALLYHSHIPSVETVAQRHSKGLASVLIAQLSRYPMMTRGQAFSPMWRQSETLYRFSTCLPTSMARSNALRSILASPQTRQQQKPKLGRVEITTFFKAVPDCESGVSVSTCTLEQTIVEYSVVLQRGIISLQHPHWQNDTILYKTQPWDESESLGLDDSFPLWTSSKNWVNFFNVQFNEELDRYGDGSLGPANNRPVFRRAQQFINDDAVNSLSSVDCNTTFGDSSQYVVDQMREMAFRTSVAAAAVENNTIIFRNDSLVASGLPLIQNWTQTIPYTGRSTHAVYSVSTSYLISSVVVSLLGVVAVAALYWGWWELGRDVSFNPLEVAKAFDAEILRDADSNMSKEDLVKIFGEREVRYRVVNEGMKGGFEDITNGGGK